MPLDINGQRYWCSTRHLFSEAFSDVTEDQMTEPTYSSLYFDTVTPISWFTMPVAYLGPKVCDLCTWPIDGVFTVMITKELNTLNCGTC